MRPKVSDVLTAVTAVFGVPRALLLSDMQIWEYARPRQVAMYLAREMCGLSYPSIGAEFNRDHTTAIWANRRIPVLLESGEIKPESLTACRELIWRLTDMRRENLTIALSRPLVVEAYY